MDHADEIFANAKWSLVAEIAKRPQSASELAVKTSTSISNIIQQLKLLEAYGTIKRIKTGEMITGGTPAQIPLGKKQSGKPKQIYALNIEAVQLAILRNGAAEKKTISIDATNSMFFNLLTALSPEDIMVMITFMIKHEDIVKKCRAISITRTTRDSIELFLITDHVDEIRAKFSNLFIEDLNGRTKKIINWTHNEFEINDGLNRHDKYFIDMVKNSQIISDPKFIMAAIKNRLVK